MLYHNEDAVNSLCNAAISDLIRIIKHSSLFNMTDRMREDIRSRYLTKLIEAVSGSSIYSALHQHNINLISGRAMVADIFDAMCVTELEIFSEEEFNMYRNNFIDIINHGFETYRDAAIDADILADRSPQHEFLYFLRKVFEIPGIETNLDQDLFDAARRFLDMHAHVLSL